MNIPRTTLAYLSLLLVTAVVVVFIIYATVVKKDVDLATRAVGVAIILFVPIVIVSVRAARSLGSKQK